MDYYVDLSNVGVMNCDYLNYPINQKISIQFIYLYIYIVYSKVIYLKLLYYWLDKTIIKKYMLK